MEFIKSFKDWVSQTYSRCLEGQELDENLITEIARQFLETKEEVFSIHIITDIQPGKVDPIARNIFKQIKDKIIYMHYRKLALLHDKLPVELLKIVKQKFALDISFNTRQDFMVKRERRVENSKFPDRNSWLSIVSPNERFSTPPNIIIR